ncbi:hypothetical protein V5O48_016748 [Marasmius crinis-equi]|uniref:Protein-S-isoprenylcysteine O-methyltransferase n=1 Tax=Marasmius crinis-equi TaxID=585013 RepID=A0ABR3EQV8_9AGAR
MGCSISRASVLDCLSVLYPQDQLRALPIPIPPSTTITATATVTMQIFVLMLSISGGILRLRAFQALGTQFTFNISPSTTSKLITTGPYTIVRHPSYLGVLGLNSGLIAYHYIFARPGPMRFWAGTSYVGLVLVVLCVLMLLTSIYTTMWRATDEDEMLKRKFGEEWEQWRREEETM